MAVSVNVSNGGNSVLIAISGRFDIYTHLDLRNSYINEKTDATYTIDLSKTEYMDSSALGMLLLLRDFAGGDAANIVISGSSDSLNRNFSITSIEGLFTFI